MTTNSHAGRSADTYLRNNIRTDVFQIDSPTGYGVPMSPVSVYQIVPIIFEEGNGDFHICSEQFIPAAGGNLKFNEKSPAYVKSKSGGYIQLDCLRCIDIVYTALDAPLAGKFVIISGEDDRGVAVQERLCLGVSNSHDPLISNKTYYRVHSITVPSGGTTTKFLANPSNTFFGMPTFMGNPGNLIKCVKFKTGAIKGDDEDIEYADIITGVNFRLYTPNIGTLSVDNGSIVKGSPIINALSKSPRNNPDPAIGDARGIIHFQGTNLADNDILSIMVYNIGADSTVNSMLSFIPSNGSNLTQFSFQRAVSLSDHTAAQLPNNHILRPTTLSQFDLFGAQYPGDRVAYNTFLSGYPGHKPPDMV